MKVILLRSRAVDSAVYKLADTLSAHGYDVTLVLWDRHGALKSHTHTGYSIASFDFRSPADTLTAILFFPLWWIFECYYLATHPCDVIHACDLDTLYPAIVMKHLRNVRLNYTIFDFYANNLPDGFPSQVRAFIRDVVGSIEKFGIRFTDVLFLVDKARYHEVEGSAIKRLVYINNSPPDLFERKEIKGISGNQVPAIFYAGVIHKSRGLACLLESVKDISGVRLIIAGTGPDVPIVEHYLTKGDVNIEYLGWIPYDKVLRTTSESDIVVALYDPAIPINRYASPNKLFEAMMCGKPILVSDGSSMAEIVKEEGCGIVIPYNDMMAMRDAILLLINNPVMREKLGSNGRSAYEEKYSWKIMEQRLLDAYQQFHDSPNAY